MPATLLSRRTAVLYAGVAIFVALALFTARAIWSAWNERSGEARAAALFDLVGQRMPPRPTEAPGAMAWLQRELERYAGRLDPERARLYRQFAAASDGVPRPLDGALAEMRAATADPSASSRVRWLGPADSPAESSRRRLVVLDGYTFVVTRRRALESAAQSAGDAAPDVVRWAVAFLADAKTRVDRDLSVTALPAVPGDRSPRPVRLYIVAEDGTLVS